MKSINDRIIKLNELFCSNIEVFKRQNSGVVGTHSKILGLHKYGLRKLTTTYPNGRKVISKAHRWEHWREIEKIRMLHLNDEQRALVGQTVVKFFYKPVHTSDLIIGPHAIKI